jgi:hypothetical protein
MVDVAAAADAPGRGRASAEDEENLLGVDDVDGDMDVLEVGDKLH